MLNQVVKQGLAVSFVVALVAAPAFAQVQATAPVQPDPSAQVLPPAQRIIDRHIEAVGGRDAIKSHSSVAAKGTISIPANGMTGTIEVFAARPNKALARTTLVGIGEVREGFDGTVAWSISPMTGPMLATGEELAQKALDADFDGALGIASKYESIKTLEKTTFEGRPVYRIALTRKIGGDDIEFYDVETGLKAGGIVQRKNPMGTISVTSAVSDYKKFGNLLQPTVMKQSTQGVNIITTFTSFEYDSVQPSMFELPAEIKALVK
jgi:hypothetical protein